MLSKHIIKFIRENKNIIESNQFDQLYQSALADKTMYNIGQLTDALMDAGLDVLAHMKELPNYFLDSSFQKTIIIPENVQCLRALSFYNSGIQTVELHDNVELVERSFFGAYNLKEIKVPFIMNEIPEDCFHSCIQLEKVDLGSIEQIGEGAFSNCTKLKSLTIPPHVDFISSTAFEGSYGITLYCYKSNADVVKEFVDKYGVKSNLRCIEL